MYRKGEENRNMFNDLRNKVRAYQANQAQTIIGAGIIGIAILVIVLVYSQVEQSLPTPTNAALASASTNVTSTFAASMELAPVILIVLVASVILLVVNRFR